MMKIQDLEKYSQVVLYGMGTNGKTILPKLLAYIKGELLCFDRVETEYLSQPICPPDFSCVKDDSIIIITPTVSGILREMYDSIPLGMKHVVTLYDFTDYDELMSSDLNSETLLGAGYCPQCNTRTDFIRVQYSLQVTYSRRLQKRGLLGNSRPTAGFLPS